MNESVTERSGNSDIEDARALIAACDAAGVRLADLHFCTRGTTGQPNIRAITAIVNQIAHKQGDAPQERADVTCDVTDDGEGQESNAESAGMQSNTIQHRRGFGNVWGRFRTSIRR